MKIKSIISKIALILFIISTTQAAFSQANYLPGYIIRLKGDTLHGYIDYRNREKSPEKISFKEKLNDDNSRYYPLDIKGYSVSGEIYESAIIQTEVSPVSAGVIESGAELLFADDTAFLQTMIKGEKCLYYYKNKLGKNQFYIKNDSAYDLLIYKKYLKDVNGTTGSIENKTYVGQLSVYLQDCSTIRQKVNTIKYDKKSLENLFQFYYKCTGTEIKFQKKTEKATLQIGLMAGLSLTTLEITSYSLTYLMNAGYKQSDNIMAGVFFNLVLPKYKGKWSIYNEISYTSYKVDGSYTKFESENKFTIYNTSFAYSYLKMNNMMRFKYPVGSFFVFLNAGISNGYALSETNYMQQINNYYSIGSEEIKKALDATRKYEQGYIFGLGVGFKKINFEIRHETGNGMSDYTSLSSKVKRNYFMLGYRF